MDDSEHVIGEKITVIGLGGAGCNTVSRITDLGIKSAETIAMNSDKLHLGITRAHKKHVLGYSLTRGLGCGGFPELGARAAEADKAIIQDMLKDSELVFVCAGMGGGTGGGAAPVVSKIAKEQGATVVAMVTFPFALERARLKKAIAGIQQLRQNADTVVLIDNNKLASYVPNLPLDKAFSLADEIVANAVMGISDTIKLPSLLNVDFADVKNLMTNKGLAMISVGEGKGADRVQGAIDSTLANPLLDVEVAGANGALIHIAGGKSLTLGDAVKIGEGISATLAETADVKMGARVVDSLGDTYLVTSIVTGVKSRILDYNFTPTMQYSDKEKQEMAEREAQLISLESL
ncbi:MAG: cell division protein FtsZ [Candidatus Micrarchaeia archaeon]